MKQSKTIKFLAVASLSLMLVATGCERRTRPPAKPPAVKTEGPDAAKKPNGAPPVEGAVGTTPTPTPPAETGTTPVAKTADEQAQANSAELQKYLVELSKSFIVIKEGPKDQAGKATYVIDEKALSDYYEATKKLMLDEEAADAKAREAALAKFKNPDGLVAFMRDNLNRKAADPKEHGLEHVLGNFITVQSGLLKQIKDTKVAEQTQATIEYAEGVVKAIPAAVKHLETLK